MDIKDDLLNKRFIEFVSNTTDLQPDTKIRIKDIFNSAWSDFLIYAKAQNYEIRDVVLEEIDRITKCGSLSEGYYTYVCKDCDKVHYCPFRCHSRFCPSCGVKTILEKTDDILEKMVNVPHRHLVFTIPEELREIFLKKRKICINILFEAVNDTIKYIIKQSTSKKESDEDYVPGFISTLHTFGRDLKWNPHIHVIIAECLSGKNNIYKKLFIPYALIRKSFQNVLLKKLENHLKVDQFRALKNKIYSNTKNGFYVYAKKDSCKSIKDTVKYTIRYHGRPAIAESRIISFDGTIVKFWYDRHEDGKRVIETLHVFEFIKRLIIHIQDKYTNTIRYYGFYNRPLRQSSKLRKLVNETYFKARKCIDSWRNRIRFYFNTDPLICKFCGKLMELSSITIKDNTFSLNTC